MFPSLVVEELTEGQNFQVGILQVFRSLNYFILLINNTLKNDKFKLKISLIPHPQSVMVQLQQ